MNVWPATLIASLFVALTLVQSARVMHRRSGLVVVVCLALAALAGFWWSGNHVPAAPNDARALAEAAPAVPDLSQVDYTTSTSCRKCHADYYATWYQSYHRTMTREATPEYVRGNFDDHEVEISGLPARFFREGSLFLMETVDPEWEQAALAAGTDPAAEPNPPRRLFPVDRVIGSHISQVYLSLGPRDHPSRQRGVYFTLPYEYSLLDGRWHSSVGSFMQPEPPSVWSQAAIWNQNCILCHNVKPRSRQTRAAPRVFKDQPAELGIACEMCHGPGKLHVERNRDPLRRLTLAEDHDDSTILNPSKLDAEAASALCGRCHSKIGLKDAQVAGLTLRNGEDPYTPGDPLSRWFTMPMPDVAAPMRRGNLFWPDGTPLAPGVEYQGLLLSPCYEHGRGKRRLSCLSCHSMHESDPVDQLAAGHRTNRACTQCHEQYKDEARLAKHTHHMTGSAGSLCYNCHMPNVVYGLLGVHRSHRVITPSAVTSAARGLPNACNLCHLEETLAWTAGKLTEWYGGGVAELDADDEQIASSVLLLLRGDAVERAVAANAFWRAASDEIEPGLPSPEPRMTHEQIRARRQSLQWAVPFLTVALDDPYAAVRLQAHRALRVLGADPDDRYFYLDLPGRRGAVAEELLAAWQARFAAAPPRATMRVPPAVPINEQREPDAKVLERLRANRDDRAISIAE